MKNFSTIFILPLLVASFYPLLLTSEQLDKQGRLVNDPVKFNKYYHDYPPEDLEYVEYQEEDDANFEEDQDKEEIEKPAPPPRYYYVPARSSPKTHPHPYQEVRDNGYYYNPPKTPYGPSSNQFDR